PPGGFIDAGGTLYFSPGSRLGLAHMEGVEMSFGRSGEFGVAPPWIDLLRDEPRLFSFRAAGAGSQAATTELFLVPRRARARVEFGPRTPSWPGKPLEISVKVQDNLRATAAADANPVVTVGVEPVAVKFRREGESLKGELPPQAGPGPWVVRVVVKDPNGLELGRDFVEIASGR
ncbi:MAG TPA: hypothetical protein VGQ57_09710, partial [Polyangiaceae bacterium]|nr:hypothetical protein [Polyangiaceae bacterium]